MCSKAKISRRRPGTATKHNLDAPFWVYHTSPVSGLTIPCRDLWGRDPPVSHSMHQNGASRVEDPARPRSIIWMRHFGALNDLPVGLSPTNLGKLACERHFPVIHRLKLVYHTSPVSGLTIPCRDLWEMSFTCEQATWGHMTPHEKELSTGGGSAGGERLLKG
jgi:hypothetical protein